jgi:tRNA A37 threonylcarbamoyladenosine dehydratase
MPEYLGGQHNMLRDGVALALGAALGAAAALASVRAFLDAPSPRAPPQPPPPPPGASEYEDELLAEQLSRNRFFFGDEGQAAVARAFVVVVGCGGVGSHAAHMLARSGVARLRLVDVDHVSLSSLNRAATATRADVGTPKVDALARAIAAFAPRCAVERAPVFFEAASAATLLAGSPDFVIDCIDDTTTKTELLLFCARARLRVVASLGAGGIADPTRLRFADLSLIHGDPLGVTIKYALRRAGLFAPQGPDGAPAEGAERVPSLSGITALYSAEPPRAPLMPLELRDGESAADLGARAGMRVRILPVLGPLPAIFGQALAAFVLCALAGTQHALVPLEAAPSPSGGLYKLRLRLERWEEAAAPHGPGFGATGGASAEDVAFLVDNVFHARSAISHARFGVRGVTLALVRWRLWRPTVPSNLVLVTDDEVAELAAADEAARTRERAREAIDAGADFNRPRGASGAAAAEAALEDAWLAARRAALGAARVAAIEGTLAGVARLGWP